MLSRLTMLAAMMLSPVNAWAADRQASFVIDANTGQVISAYKADEPRHPASLTKMMTLYIVFDLIQRGRLSYQTRVTITDHAASAQPTKLDLPAGTEIALIDAIKALVTHSANDVAIAIAEHIAGSEEKFANLMTQRAHAIGMSGSTFKNASGLPNAEQITTARDMVTLGLRLQDEFPEHYRIFSLRAFDYSGHTYANHNTMLGTYEGTDGIKTGYTAASGFNVVTSVKRGPKHVVGAVFGGVSAVSRNMTMRTLLNMAIFKASTIKTRAPLVARLNGRPVPQPTPAERPSKSVVVASNAAAVPSGWPSTVVSSASAPPMAESGATHSKVDIARVRPVLIAPAPSQASVPALSMQAPAGLARAEPQAPPVANAHVDFRLPPLTSVSAPKAVVASAQPPARTIAMEAASPARGKPPSTLQQQMASLSGTTPTAYRLNGPAPSPGTSVEIQIGAYATAAEAQRQLELARSRAADVIGRAPAVTPLTTANGRSLWRARFAGFDVSAAGGICTELRRRQIDCLVAKPE